MSAMVAPKLRRISPILILPALVLAGCAGSTPGDPPRPRQPGSAIRFLNRHDLPLAQARINGAEAGFFLLDTGSTLTVLNQSVAEKLKVPLTDDHVQVTGIAGNVNAPLARIDHLTVGGVVLAAAHTAVVDLSAFNQNVGWPVAGILGFDSLRDALFTLDFQTNTVTFEDPRTFAPPVGVAPLPMTMVGNLPAVRGKIGDNDAWLQIDTGSNGTVALAYSQVKKRLELMDGAFNVQGNSFGVGGRASTVSSELRSLLVFGHRFDKTPFQLEMAGPVATMYGQSPVLIGRLGNQLLKQFRITFDYPHDRLWAEWVGK